MADDWVYAHEVHARYCNCGGASNADAEAAEAHNKTVRCSLCATVGMCGRGWHRVGPPGAIIEIDVLPPDSVSPPPLRNWRRLHEMEESPWSKNL